MIKVLFFSLLTHLTTRADTCHHGTGNPVCCTNNDLTSCAYCDDMQCLNQGSGVACSMATCGTPVNCHDALEPRTSTPIADFTLSLNNGWAKLLGDDLRYTFFFDHVITWCPMFECKFVAEHNSEGYCLASSPSPSFQSTMVSGIYPAVNTDAGPFYPTNFCLACRSLTSSSNSSYKVSKMHSVQVLDSPGCSSNTVDVLPPGGYFAESVFPIYYNLDSSQSQTLQTQLSDTGTYQCQITSVSIVEESLIVSHPEIEAISSDSSGNVVMAPKAAFKTQIKEYKYRLLVHLSSFSVLSGMTASSKVVTWYHGYCDDFGATVTQNAFTDSEQRVVLGDPTAVFFTLPTYTISINVCTIYKIQTSSSDTTISAVDGLNAEAEIDSGGNWIVKPTDLTQDNYFEFYIKAWVEKDADYWVTGPLKFTVGCPSEYATLTESGSTFADEQWVLPDDAATYFQINEFSSSEAACPPSYFQTGASSADPFSAFDSSLLNDPEATADPSLWIVRPVDPSLRKKYEFYARVSASSTGGAHVYSSKKTLFVGCPSSEVFISSPAPAFGATQYVAAGAGPFSFEYTLFTSSADPNCLVTSYKSSVTSGSLTAVDMEDPVITTVGAVSSKPSVTSPATIQFYARGGTSTSDLDAFAYSSLFTLVIGCDSTNHNISYVLPAGFQEYQNYAVGTTPLKFTYSEATSNLQAACPIDATYATTTKDTAAIDPHPDLGSPTAAGGGTVEIARTSSATVVQFYLIFEFSSGEKQAHPNLLTLQESSCPSTITATNPVGDFTQYFSNQESTNGQAKFLLPEYDGSVASCPLLSIRPTSSFNSFVAMSEVSDSLLDSSNRRYVSPTTAVQNTEIEFYAEMLFSGGNYDYSPKLTLVVGCPSITSWTETHSVSQTVPVGGTGPVVYNFTLPTFTSTSPAGNCQILTTALDSIEVNGASNPSFLKLDSSCAQPCLEISAQTRITSGTVIFKMKSLIDSSTFFLSSVITLSFECDASSTSIFFPPTTAITPLYFESTSNVVEFALAICSAPDCCTSMTYYISSDSSDRSSSIAAFGSHSPSGSVLQATLDTSTIASYDLYIFVENSHGATARSDPYQVQVIFDCSSDTLSYNQEGPSEAELRDLGSDGIFLKSDSGASYILGALEVNQSSGFDFDVTSRFKTSSPSGSCPISYSLDQVLASDGTAIANASSQFSLSSDGIFSVDDLTTEFADYQIFISAANASVSLNSTKHGPLLRLTLSQERVELPNIPPVIDSSLLVPYAVEINLEELDGKAFKFSLPKIFDANGDLVFVSLAGPVASFISIDRGLKILEIDSSQLLEDVNTTVPVEVSDSRGGTSVYDIVLMIRLARDYRGSILLPEVKQPDQDNSSKPGFEAEIEKIDSDNAKAEHKVVAKISEVSVFGEVEVVFNSTLHPEVMPGLFTNETLSVELLPPRGVPFRVNWEVKSLQPTQLKLHLNFDQPLNVSLEAEQDTLVLHFSDEARAALYFPNLDVYLHRDSAVLRSKIKKQMPDSAFAKNFETAAESLEISLIVLLIVTFILNYVLSGGFIHMLMLIRALQIVLHLPLLRIIVPGNVSRLFSILIPVATFDVLDPSWTTELVFDFDDEKQTELQSQLLDQLEDLGYETHNAMLNLGSLALFTLFYFMQVGLYFTTTLLRKFGFIKSQFFAEAKDRLFFGELIGLLLDAYFEFLIAGYLQLRAPLNSTNGERLSVVVGAFGYFLILGFMTFGFIKMLVTPLPRLQSEEFSTRWGALLDMVKIRSKWTIAYYPIFALRRVVFFSLAFFVEAAFQFQLLGLIFLNLAVFAYQGQHSPLDGQLYNRLEMANEFLIACITFHLLLFTAWVPSAELQYNFGWSQITLVGILLGLNLWFVLIKGLHQLQLLLHKIKLKALTPPRLPHQSQPLLQIPTISENSSSDLKIIDLQTQAVCTVTGGGDEEPARHYESLSFKLSSKHSSTFAADDPQNQPSSLKGKEMSFVYSEDEPEQTENGDVDQQENKVEEPKRVGYHRQASTFMSKASSKGAKADKTQKATKPTKVFKPAKKKYRKRSSGATGETGQSSETTHNKLVREQVSDFVEGPPALFTQQGQFKKKKTRKRKKNPPQLI